MNNGVGLQRTASWDFDSVRKDPNSLVEGGADPAGGVEVKENH
jgi:hypothetical protein